MAAEEDPMERELFASSIAQPRDSARYVAALEIAVRTRLDDPEVDRHPDLERVCLELAREYQVLKRWEDALVAADAVAELEPDMQPDARCLRAEILMRMGRVAEAEPIWAAVRTETPDDVWLYYRAGMEYAAIGDHQTALDWLNEGVRVALRTDGPDAEDPLTEELAELRQATLDNLGRPADELQEQAATFLREKAEQERAEARREASEMFGLEPGRRPIRPTKRRH